MSDKVDYKIPEAAVEKALHVYYDGTYDPWSFNPAASGEKFDAMRAALEAALPLLPASGGPERDYEPGTRFVVVEIPPAATDQEADEITEKVFEAAYDIDAQYVGPWDLFIYRQHNAPPANIPASGGPADASTAEEQHSAGRIDRQVIERVIEEHKAWDGLLAGSVRRRKLADALVAALTEQPNGDGS